MKLLNKDETKVYILRRGLSLHEVVPYCDISFPLINMIGMYGKADGTFKQIDKTKPKKNTNNAKPEEMKIKVKLNPNRKLVLV